MQNAAGSASISKSVPMDSQGHHVLLSGDGTGATIYVDGIAAATVPSIGPLRAADVNVFLRTDTAHAGTLYLRRRMWAGYRGGRSSLAQGSKRRTR
jgi:hypothetical protein